MFTCPTVETDRLILRPFAEADLDAYFAVLDTAEVRASLHKPADFDRNAAWNEMAIWLGQWAMRNSGQWAVERKDTGEFIGRLGTHRPARDDWPGLEIGWTLHPDHWGQGFATEGGRTAVEWAFANHGVSELVSVIHPTNEPSQAVARRLGFSLREEKVLSLLPSAALGIWVLPRPTS